MPPSPLSLAWRRFRGSDRYAECVRVGLALGGIVAWCLARQQVHAVIPALLGAIACALAETEDRWRNRLGTLLVTLACFAIAAVSVQRLLPSPWLFAASLAELARDRAIAGYEEIPLDDDEPPAALSPPAAA